MAKDKKVKQENKEAKPEIKSYEDGFLEGRKYEKQRVIRLLKKHDLWFPKKKE